MYNFEEKYLEERVKRLTIQAEVLELRYDQTRKMLDTAKKELSEYNKRKTKKKK